MKESGQQNHGHFIVYFSTSCSKSYIVFQQLKCAKAQRSKLLKAASGQIQNISMSIKKETCICIIKSVKQLHNKNHCNITINEIK